MVQVKNKYTGLNDEQVLVNRKLYGMNNFDNESRFTLLLLLRDIFLEPMFILLLVTCSIYFILKEFSEGVTMLVAMAFVGGISIFQENRSKKALNAIKKLSAARARVIRNGITTEIDTAELVVGDILLAGEGETIPADAVLLESHDFSVDESLLTGESVAVFKKEDTNAPQILYGTTVKTGQSIARVTATGKNTFAGNLGKTVEQIETSESHFQKEITSFVRKMALTGFLAFLTVWLINFISTGNFLTSLLFALALAMAIIPEEIPVAFSSFMAIGALRLLKKDILVKNPKTVETLGSATVVCTDKTGTITENRMKLAAVYSFDEHRIYSEEKFNKESSLKVISYAMWASEKNPFDPMEVAIHEAYEQYIPEDKRHLFDFVHEYPLSGLPPTMTHLLENEKKERIVACKGGVESIVEFAGLSQTQKDEIFPKVAELASKGFRVLGVAFADFEGYSFPEQQKDFNWKFAGLVALYDPPKRNIRNVLKKFYDAGIKVKIISGDYAETTLAIANEIGFLNHGPVITGKQILEMKEEDLQATVGSSSIFARMFPEAKLRIVNALKANGETVAMTGDGVNDGPALKAAHIGIAMGRKGTEIAKGAASLVLLDDDLDKMAYAIAAGRKIYINLKKAIRYIVSIHVPIILIVLLPLLFNWSLVNIFSPIHIVFFELIMGPTCSIIYENEPMEANLMHKKPRYATPDFLTFKELTVSIVQGLCITAGLLIIYYISIQKHFDLQSTRTLIFTTIALSNIFLTFENRSFSASVFKTIFYKNNLMYYINCITIALLVVILTIPSVRTLFQLDEITLPQLMLCIATAFVCVFWNELYKIFRNRNQRQENNTKYLTG